MTPAHLPNPQQGTEMQDNDSNNSPSKTAKAAGLKSIEQVSQLTGKPRVTINNWFHRERSLFDVVIAGCVAILEDRKRKAQEDEKNENPNHS